MARYCNLLKIEPLQIHRCKPRLLQELREKREEVKVLFERIRPRVILWRYFVPVRNFDFLSGLNQNRLCVIGGAFIAYFCRFA